MRHWPFWVRKRQRGDSETEALGTGVAFIFYLDKGCTPRVIFVRADSKGVSGGIGVRADSKGVTDKFGKPATEGSCKMLGTIGVIVGTRSDLDSWGGLENGAGGVWGAW